MTDFPSAYRAVPTFTSANASDSLLRDLARAKAEAQLRAIRAFMCAPAHGSKPDQEIAQGRWCWACLRHEVQADGWCRKCGGMTGQPQEKGE